MKEAEAGELEEDETEVSLNFSFTTEESVESYGDATDAAPPPGPVVSKSRTLETALRSSLGTNRAASPQKNKNNTSMERDSPPRVHFFGIEDASHDETKMNDMNYDNNTKASVERLQTRLTNALIDLSAEKAQRKRKEKNLIKLAKELQRRASELDAKNRQIGQLLNTMQEMDQMLTGRGLGAGGGLGIGQQGQDSISNLRRQLLQAHMELHRLETTPKRGNTNNSSHRGVEDEFLGSPWQTLVAYWNKSSRVGLRLMRSSFGIFILLALLLLIFAATASTSSSSSAFSASTSTMDFLCAPALPGTVLSTTTSTVVPWPWGGDVEVTTLEAPWWVPSFSQSSIGMKRRAFALVCGSHRIRTRLVWTSSSPTGGKLTAYKLIADSDNSNSGEQKEALLLWHGRGHSAQVTASGKAIVLRDKRGTTVAERAAPWTLPLQQR